MVPEEQSREKSSGFILWQPWMSVFKTMHLIAVEDRLTATVAKRGRITWAAPQLIFHLYRCSMNIYNRKVTYFLVIYSLLKLQEHRVLSGCTEKVRWRQFHSLLLSTQGWTPVWLIEILESVIPFLGGDVNVHGHWLGSPYIVSLSNMNPCLLSLHTVCLFKLNTTTLQHDL